MNEHAELLRDPPANQRWWGPDAIMGKGADEIDRLEAEATKAAAIYDQVCALYHQEQADNDRLEAAWDVLTADIERLVRANKLMAERSGRLEADNKRFHGELIKAGIQRNQLSTQAAETIRELKAELAKAQKPETRTEQTKWREVRHLRTELTKVRAELAAAQEDRTLSWEEEAKRHKVEVAKFLTHCRDCVKRPTCPTMTSCKSHDCSDCSNPGPCEGVYCWRFKPKSSKPPSPSPALVKAAEEFAAAVWGSEDRRQNTVIALLAVCAAMEDSR